MDDPVRDGAHDADLGARLRAIASWGEPREIPELDDLRAATTELAPRRDGRSLRLWVPLAAAAAVAVVVGIVAFATPGGDAVDVAGGSDFASAIGAAGVLRSPSADEVEQAMNRDLYKPQTGQTQVSATGNYVSLRTCRFALEPRPESSSACPAGWAYTAGTVDGAEVHRGLLGEANHLELHVVDDRYFLASESTPDAQAPLAVWLIDAVSGQVGALTWRDAPTTLRSPQQALVLCDESFDRKCFGVRGPDAPDGGHHYIATDAGLPQVIDARDGTIQPLEVPEDVESGLPVTQDGTGRIWVGTASGDDQLGLAYTDDGGATWTAVALPEVVQEMGHELARDLSDGDTLLEIAADGDRVAVTRSWAGPEERPIARGRLYLSDDAGRSWTPHAPLDPQGNGAHLYVLADGRLLLVWSVDSNATQALVSTGSDWAALEQVHIPEMTADHDLLEDRDFNVNRDGIAFSSSILDPCNAENARCSGDPDIDPPLSITLRFSTDLTNWRTIERLDD